MISTLSEYSRFILQGGLVFIIQSTVLIILTLFAADKMRARGPALQAMIYRASVLGLAVLLLIRFAGLNSHGVWGIANQRQISESAGPVSQLLSAPPLPHPLKHSMSFINSAQDSPLIHSTNLPQTSSQVLMLLVGVWIVGVLFQILTLAASHFIILGMRRSSRPVLGKSLDRLQNLARKDNLQAPELVVCVGAHSPFLAGFVRPVILLPEDYETQFSEQELDAILAHELSHLARRDIQWNMCCRLLSIIAWPQPLLLLLSRRMTQANEEACDLAAVQQNISASLYASCLVNLSDRMTSSLAERTLGTGITGFKSSLGKRVELIMKNSQLNRYLSRKTRAAVALGIAAAIFVGTTLLGVQSLSARQSASNAGKYGIVVDDRSTPQAALVTFTKSLLAGDLELAARCVQNGAQSVYSDDLKELFTDNMISFSLTDVVTETHDDTARISAHVSFKTKKPVSLTNDETEIINLARTDSNWKIVAPTESAWVNGVNSKTLAVIAMRFANPSMIKKMDSDGVTQMCLSNLKQVSLATQMYLQDFDETFPPIKKDYKKMVAPYLKRPAVFFCPAAPKTAYTLNTNLQGLKVKSVRMPRQTVLLYDGKKGKLEYRHDGRASVSFVDGHAKLVTPEEAAKVRWTP